MDRTFIVIKGLSDSISPLVSLIITFGDEIESPKVIDNLTFNLISVIANKVDGAPVPLGEAPWDTTQFLSQIKGQGIKKIEVVTSEPLKDVVPNTLIDFFQKLRLALLADKSRLKGEIYFYAVYGLGWFNTNIVKVLSWLARHNVKIIHPKQVSTLEEIPLFCLVFSNIVTSEFHYLLSNYYARLAISIYDKPAEKLFYIRKERLLRHHPTIGKYPRDYYIWFDMIMAFLVSKKTKIEGQYLRSLVKKHGISKEIEQNITPRGVEYLLGIICKNMQNPTLNLGQWILLRFRNHVTSAIQRSKLCNLTNTQELLVEIAILEFQGLLEIKLLLPEVWKSLRKDPSIFIITDSGKRVEGLLAAYSCLLTPWSLPYQAPDVLLYYLKNIRPHLESQLDNLPKPHNREFDYISSYSIGELKKHLALDYWKRNKHLFQFQHAQLNKDLYQLEDDLDREETTDYLRVAVEQDDFNQVDGEEDKEVISDDFIEALLKELGLNDSD